MKYRSMNTRHRKNSGWPATISEFVPGETYMHTGQYEIEPVQFVRYTRYGAGSSWGDPSRVEVRDRSGRLWETTVTRLRLPREGEVRNPGRKKNPDKGTPRQWAKQAAIHLRNYREDPTSTLERDFAVADLNKIVGEPQAAERLRSDARRAAILLNTSPLSDEAWHAVHSLFPSATGYRKSHHPTPGRRGNPPTFSQKSELFRKQLAAFKRSSHIPARRRATARAIQDFLRREPFFEQTLPYDLLGVIRSAARESEVSRGRHASPTAHMGDRVEFYAPGDLLKTGKVVGVYNGEYTVQIGDYGYAVKPHDIKRVYPR